MLKFIVAVIWGSLAGQFLMQIIVCLIIAGIALSGLLFAQVQKSANLIGLAVALTQILLFGVLFVGGNWLTADYIGYGEWTIDFIASLVAFLGTIVYVTPQIGGKLLIARMCSWRPMFFEASNAMPRNERVTFARRIAKELSDLN